VFPLLDHLKLQFNIEETQSRSVINNLSITTQEQHTVTNLEDTNFCMLKAMFFNWLGMSLNDDNDLMLDYCYNTLNENEQQFDIQLDQMELNNELIQLPQVHLVQELTVSQQEEMQSQQEQTQTQTQSQSQLQQGNAITK